MTKNEFWDKWHPNEPDSFDHHEFMADLEALRCAALEEAAVVCESYALQIEDKIFVTCNKNCATAIRALRNRAP